MLCKLSFINIVYPIRMQQAHDSCACRQKVCPRESSSWEHPYTLAQGNSSLRQNSRGVNFNCYYQEFYLNLSISVVPLLLIIPTPWLLFIVFFELS